MANIYGNDKKPLQLYTKKVPAELFKSTGITDVDDKDISEVFEEKLGTTYNDSEHFLYPTQSRGIDTEALYHSLFVNIGAIIGNIPDNSSIGDLLTVIQNKLESNIDPNILLNLISKILGPGIYNNGLNGAPVNFTTSSDSVSFITTSIDSIIFHNGLAIYKNIGNKSILIDYSDRKAPNITLEYKYVFVVKNVGESAFSYLKLIPNSELIDNEDDQIALFMIEQDKLNESIDLYRGFINNGEIIELYSYYVKLGSSAQLIDFTNKRHFEPQNSNSFTISQLRDAMSGNAVSLEFPKDMVEIIDTNSNDSINYVTKKMGEIVTLDDSYYEKVKDKLHVVELSDTSRKMSDDEKVKYEEYINEFGDVIPGDSLYNTVKKLNNNFEGFEHSILGSIITFPKKISGIESKGYLEMNGGEYSQSDYPEFTEWCKLYSPDYLSGSKIILPNWTARYLRNNGSITLSAPVNGTTTYNAGVPGTFSFDAMQRLTGNFGKYSYKPAYDSGIFYSDNINNNLGGVNAGSDNSWSISHFDNARQARTDTENRPFSVAVVYYIKVKNMASGQIENVVGPVVGKIYNQGSFIYYYGVLYACIKDTKWTGVIDQDWQEYAGRYIYNFKGTVQNQTNLPKIAANGTCFYVTDDNKTYVFADDTWSEVSPIIDTSDFIHKNDVYELIQKNIKPKYNDKYIYKKGDIVYIEPDTYDEITLSAGTHVNHLGKNVTYQAETKVKRYDVRLRSTKDNNTSNPVTTLGTDWVVDEPQVIAESGTSANSCKYKLFANGESVNYRENVPLPRSNVGRAEGVFNLAVNNVARGAVLVGASTSPGGVGDFVRTTSVVYYNGLQQVGIVNSSTVDTADIYMPSCSFIVNGYWY